VTGHRCLVVGADPAVTASVAAVVDMVPELTTSGVLEPAAALSGIRPACDAILACDGPGQPALELAASLIRTCHDLPVILVTRAPDLAAHRAALSLGARGLLGMPPEPAQLVGAVSGTVATRNDRAGQLAAGRAVAVCAAKGGCGASSVAVELAAIGAGVLVDMGGGFDDAASRLGCSPRRTLSDIAGLDDALGPDALRSLMSTHPIGMRLIARPADPVAAAMLSADLGRAMVRESRAVSQLAIVDLGVATSETAAAVAVSADRVLLVTTPDRVAVDCAGRAAAWMDRMGVPGSSLGLIVNRWTRAGDLSLRGIERAVAVPIAAAVRDGELAGVWAPGRRGSALTGLLRDLEAA
jgi:Flp pilus assembly CpaE family ATPase